MTTTRTIAIISDLHGNLTATKAVLADAAAQQPTDYAVLGDLLMPGPGAAAIIDAVRALHPLVWLNGNWEQLLYATADGMGDTARPNHVYFARLGMYTLAHLRSEQLALMRRHPISQNIVVNGVHIGFAHNEMDMASGHDLYPQMPQADLDRQFAPGQDLFVYGHIHQQIMRTSSKGQMVLNPGAVGQPYSPWRRLMLDQRACYALLRIDAAGRCSVEFRKVEYDEDAEIQLARASDLPYLPLYRHLRRTGRTITHNQRLLGLINAQYGYDDEVRRHFQM
ncbi:metallophosphoesterase family protein [Lacticaseibacillus songhuajiangensis]|uniref:metallophosphoesterase family protein n=1 Tax=Lacticaseibacillus songhuajiangensis TaxID=1296539 RepID=UPI001CDB48F9|nr:metallophosphoesterase family protein [Lacticaseibacillus songhuajiangensis]